jgi:hypothetical protein
MKNYDWMNAQDSGADYKTKRRRRKQKFDPDREYCKKSVQEYLESGGKITKIELDENSYYEFMGITSKFEGGQI